MGRPRKTEQKVIGSQQPKAKPIKKEKVNGSTELKKTQSEGSKNQKKQRGGKKKQEKQQTTDGLAIDSIEKSIRSNANQIIEVFQQLKKFDSKQEIQFDAEEKIRQFGTACQKEALLAIRKTIIDAQHQIYEVQNSIFKNINRLQRSYSQIKQILQNTKGLSDDDRQKTLLVIDNKMNEKKEQINALKKVADKGEAIVKPHKKVE